MEWLGVVMVLVLGSALVFYGWWSDRRAAPEPPALPAAALDSLPAPDAPAAALALVALDAGGRPVAPRVPGGAADPGFLPSGGLAGLAGPDVLVVDGEIGERGATTLLLAAKGRGRPLVVAAAGFSPDALALLRANAALGHVPTLPAVVSPQDAPGAAALTGGAVVPGPDVLSGWLPAEVWGRCRAWLADAGASYVAGQESDEPHPAE